MSRHKGGMGNLGLKVNTKTTVISEDGESQLFMAYSCKFCPQVYDSRSKLRQHIDGKHKQPKYDCSGCGMKFQWRSSQFYHRQKCILYQQQIPSSHH